MDTDFAGRFNDDWLFENAMDTSVAAAAGRVIARYSLNRADEMELREACGLTTDRILG